MRGSCVAFLISGVLLGCGGSETEPQQDPAAIVESIQQEAEEESTLTDEQKNQLWWEVKQASGKIGKEIEARIDEKGDLPIIDFTDSIAREIRNPIAQKYDISYEEMMDLFDDGESADWRTEEAP